MKPYQIAKVAFGSKVEDLEYSMQQHIIKACADGYVLQQISHSSAYDTENDEITFTSAMIFKLKAEDN